MNFLDLDVADTFQECFSYYSASVVECECGREHVCINSYYWEDDEDHEAVKAYRERALTDENLVINEEYDTIREVHIAGKKFAEDCQCEGWKPYMEFIINNRKEIKQFLILLAAKATTALEHEKSFNILKDKHLKVLDQH